MQKNKKTVWDTRTLVFIGLMTAMQIVLTRLIVIELGSYRISVGSVCTILAGLWLGPTAGGICGLIADLLGCVLKGYAVNPFITLAAVLWGVVPALMRPLLGGTKKKKIVLICVGVVLASCLSTLIFTTAGLVLIQGYNLFVILPGRIVQWAIMTPIYCVLTVILYFSPFTGMILNATARHTDRAAA